jgi:hypothetical protein
MRTRVIPTWFADMPHSFTRIRTEAPKGWIPLQAFFAVAFLGAIIFNWNTPLVRLYLLLTLACYLIIGVSTGVYFVKEILAFKKMPATTPMTDDLQRRVSLWQTLTTGRNLLQVVSTVLLIIACFYL